MPGLLRKVTKPLQAVFSKHHCMHGAVLRLDTEVGNFQPVIPSGE